MVVDRISGLAQFESLRPRWAELYASDDHANLFLSWDWLHACFATETLPWMVLGVREQGGPYLAFLPLGYGRFPAIGPPLDRELYLGGVPRADYTGMLAVRSEESHVIPALARYIESLPWDNFTLSDSADERIAKLIGHFSTDRYLVSGAEPTPCPYAQLPASWEMYMSALGKDSRHNLRSKIRKTEALPGYRFEVVGADGSSDAIDVLLQLNAARWNKSLAKRRRTFGGLFERCLRSGTFIVTSLYDGPAVMAAQGSFIDAKAGSLIGYMVGYNPVYAKFSPGAVLVCQTMRYAIDNGLTTYDFARGGEAYKSTFAPKIHYTHHTTLTRRGVRAAAVNAGRSGFFAVKGVARSLLGRSA